MTVLKRLFSQKMIAIQREDVRHHVEIHARSKHGGATNVGKMEEESGAQLLACPNVFGQLVTFRQSAAMLLGTLFVIGLAVVDTHQWEDLQDQWICFYEVKAGLTNISATLIASDMNKEIMVPRVTFSEAMVLLDW